MGLGRRYPLIPAEQVFQPGLLVASSLLRLQLVLLPRYGLHSATV
jgi:hypothetical protein